MGVGIIYQGVAGLMGRGLFLHFLAILLLQLKLVCSEYCYTEWEDYEEGQSQHLRRLPQASEQHHSPAIRGRGRTNQGEI